MCASIGSDPPNWDTFETGARCALRLPLARQDLWPLQVCAQCAGVSTGPRLPSARPSASLTRGTRPGSLEGAPCQGASPPATAGMPCGLQGSHPLSSGALPRRPAGRGFHPCPRCDPPLPAALRLESPSFFPRKRPSLTLQTPPPALAVTSCSPRRCATGIPVVTPPSHTLRLHSCAPGNKWPHISVCLRIPVEDRPQFQ